MDWNYEQILQALPHRYPFLLVDKISDLIPGETATGLKNVTLGEPVFQGHFPKDPIFPGVLIVEAMAQTAAVLALASRDDSLAASSAASRSASSANASVYFMTIDGVKFRHPVRPGDVLHLKVSKEQARGTVWKFCGEAFVESRLVAEAHFMAMIKE